MIEIQRSGFRWFLEERPTEELNSFSSITDYPDTTRVLTASDISAAIANTVNISRGWLGSIWLQHCWLSVPKDIVSAIAQEAERIWGDDWFAHLVRSYCEIEGQMTGEIPLAKSRRSTIERALETGKTTLETTTWLAACVGAEIQMAIHRVEIRKF